MAEIKEEKRENNTGVKRKKMKVKRME